MGHNLYGAPYDWRLAPDGLATKPYAPGGATYYAALQALLERAVARHHRPAVLVTHSMGGPVALDFLNRRDRAWKAAHVAHFVALSPPFGGALATLEAVVSGYTFGVPVLPHAVFRPVQATCASGPWLFPRSAPGGCPFGCFNNWAS